MGVGGRILVPIRCVSSEAADGHEKKGCGQHGVALLNERMYYLDFYLHITTKPRFLYALYFMASQGFVFFL